MIAYYRVSTARQGRSGLGLEAQESAVNAHVQHRGCDLIASYTEVETGKKHSLDNRPALKKAVAHAKRSKAILVVAKLDRLLRSTVVRMLLKTSGVQFVACDNPDANELTIDILAAVAENEVREISKRTRAALAAYKARGGKLGASLPQCNTLTPEARKRGAQAAGYAVTQKANEAYSDLAEDITRMSLDGLSLRQIAVRLNTEGHTTRRGKPWNPMQVLRVLQRFSNA
jgi:DNA invertase Pin-like site-specific DNA recombinase